MRQGERRGMQQRRRGSPMKRQSVSLWVTWPTMLLLILTLALFLSACATPKGSTAFADLPPSLLVECPRPVRLPERDLTRADVTRFWSTDRAALLVCASRHAGLIEAIK